MVKGRGANYHEKRLPGGGPRQGDSVCPARGVFLYCAYCGNLAIGDAFYCGYCGRLLDAPSPADETSLGASTVPWRGGQVAWGVLIVAIAAVLIALAASGLGKLIGKYEHAVVIWVSVHLTALAIACVVWRFGVHRSGRSLALLGLGRLRLAGAAGKTGLAALASNPVLMSVGVLGGSLAFTAIYGTVVDALGWDVLAPPEIPSDIAFPGAGAVLTFQALVLVTPLTEELFFRGFVLPGLAARLGVGRAIVASAVIFSVFHLDLGVLAPVFVAGLLLGWLYHRTGSLWPGVLVHGGQNALALAVQLYSV